MRGAAGALLQFKVDVGHCWLQDPELSDLELPGLQVQQHSEGHTLLGVCAGVIEKEATSTPQHLPSLNGLSHVGQPLSAAHLVHFVARQSCRLLHVAVHFLQAVS